MAIKLIILSLAFMFININGASDAKKKKINIPESIIRYIKSISDMQQDIGLNIELAGVPAELLSDKAFNNIVSILLQIKVADLNKLTDKEIVEIWDIIKYKRCNLKDLIDMIIRIEYLDIPVLRRSMLLATLEVFVTMFENNQNRAAIEQLKRLPKNISNELKYLYFDQYPMPIFHHYAHVEKDLDLQIDGCDSAFFTTNRELLISWNKDKIIVINPIDGKILSQLPAIDIDGSNTEFQEVKINSNYIIAITRSNNLFVWDIRTVELIKHMPINTGFISYINDIFLVVSGMTNQFGSLYTGFYKFGNLDEELRINHLGRICFPISNESSHEDFFLIKDIACFIKDINNQMLFIDMCKYSVTDLYNYRDYMMLNKAYQGGASFNYNNSFDSIIIKNCPRLCPKDFILRYLLLNENDKFNGIVICSDEKCECQGKHIHMRDHRNNQNFVTDFSQLPMGNINNIEIRYCENEHVLQINDAFLFRVLRNVYNQDLINLMQRIYPEKPGNCSVM